MAKKEISVDEMGAIKAPVEEAAPASVEAVSTPIIDGVAVKFCITANTLVDGLMVPGTEGTEDVYAEHQWFRNARHRAPNPPGAFEPGEFYLASDATGVMIAD